MSGLSGPLCTFLVAWFLCADVALGLWRHVWAISSAHDISTLRKFV